MQQQQPQTLPILEISRQQVAQKTKPEQSKPESIVDMIEAGSEEASMLQVPEVCDMDKSGDLKGLPKKEDVSKLEDVSKIERMGDLDNSPKEIADLPESLEENLMKSEKKQHNPSETIINVSETKANGVSSPTTPEVSPMFFSICSATVSRVGGKPRERRGLLEGVRLVTLAFVGAEVGAAARAAKHGTSPDAPASARS